MTVYIEYAFLQNFLLDGVLLWLGRKATKTPVCWWRLSIAAALGGVFAVLFPLLSLGKWWGLLLKGAVGLLLPLLAYKRLQGRKAWGRYALNACCFFLFTFLFGGSLLSFAQNLFKERLPALWVGLGFVAMTAICLFLLKIFYKKRGIYQYIYPCTAIFGETRVQTQGFLDSGNLAMKNGLPVCFLSVDILYDIVGEKLLMESKGDGQVHDEMVIATMAGEKRLPLFRGEIQMEMGGILRKKEVYFARAANSISREYKILLNARILEGEV